MFQSSSYHHMGDSTASAELPSPSSVVEKYVLDGNEDVIKFTNGRNVILSLPSEGGGERDRDSARVQTETLTEFKGETRAHGGRSLTVQKDLIASRVHLESTGDVVRVIHRVTRSRHLIKNYSSPPVDLEFAAHAPLLAVLDSSCGLYVYTVSDDCEKVEKYLNIVNWPARLGDSENPRLAWCPYAPENPTDPTDICHMVAVFQGKNVYIINLSTLVEQYGNKQVDFESACSVADAFFTVRLEEDVSVVCISPDSTAIAIGTVAGVVSFYVINGAEIKFAHNWNPRLKTAISDLFFLDDVSGLMTVKTEPERFWRHCLVAGEGGRRLALFECEHWRCLGTLRFDCALDISQFTVRMDPKMRYIHLLDSDGANIFCVELDQQSASPCFLSITQIAFCRPMSVIFPYDVQDASEDSVDPLSFSDDDANWEKDVKISYIGMSPKRLLHLDVHVERTEVEYAAPPAIAAGLDDDSVRDGDQVYSTPPVELHLPSTSEPVVSLAAATTQSWKGNTEGADGVDGRFAELNAKLEQIALQVDRAESQRRATATNDHILQMLQQFKEEFSLREDRLLANISDLIETNRTDTLDVVRNALNENSVAVESSIQLNHKQSSDAISQRVSEKMKESLTTVVVPSIDRLCTQLFRQLNETFNLGMEQYMTQFRALHNATLAAVAASATPAPCVSVSADRQSLLQMVKNNQAPLAFETVLNQGDQGALECLCNNVDPDEFFLTCSLTQPVLLSLLQQLSLQLQSETDLKFRYVEHILERVRLDDRETSPMVPKVLAGLSTALAELQTLTASPSLKRQARVLHQIVKSLQRPGFV